MQVSFDAVQDHSSTDRQTHACMKEDDALAIANKLGGIKKNRRVREKRDRYVRTYNIYVIAGCYHTRTYVRIHTQWNWTSKWQMTIDRWENESDDFETSLYVL